MPMVDRASSWSLLEIVEALGLGVYGPVGDDAQLAGIDVGDPSGARGLDAGVVIDTRLVQPGDVFVALNGERVHGMQHAAEAFERGAVAVLTGTDLEIDDERWDELLADAAQIGPVLVATDCDGVTALGRLARAWRRRSPWQVVGITGSSGKTSTKDLLAEMLRRSGASVRASVANWNNEIGVPLTLLAAGPDIDVVICEMGMRGPGQIDWLCEIADPDIGIITNAGTAHLELLGTREEIVAAKAELLAGTWRGGVGIVPGRQPELIEAAAAVPDRLLPFGVGESEAEESAVLVTSVHRTGTGIAGTVDVMGTELAFDLPLHGMHHARNVAAAAAALASLRGSAALLAPDVLVLDIDARARFAGGRGERTELARGIVVAADAYNANPESMQAALAELASITGAPRRVAVLGRMAELGDTSPSLHTHVGAFAASLDAIDELVLVGDGIDVAALAEGWERARHGAPRCYPDVDAALAASDEWLRDGDVVLVKSSLSSGLSRLADGLVERLGGGSTP